MRAATPAAAVVLRRRAPRRSRQQNCTRVLFSPVLLAPEEKITGTFPAERKPNLKEKQFRAVRQNSKTIRESPEMGCSSDSLRLIRKLVSSCSSIESEPLARNCLPIGIRRSLHASDAHAALGASGVAVTTKSLPRYTRSVQDCRGLA